MYARSWRSCRFPRTVIITCVSRLGIISTLRRESGPPPPPPAAVGSVSRRGNLNYRWSHDIHFGRRNADIIALLCVPVRGRLIDETANRILRRRRSRAPCNTCTRAFRVCEQPTTTSPFCAFACARTLCARVFTRPDLISREARVRRKRFHCDGVLSWNRFPRRIIRFRSCSVIVIILILIITIIEDLGALTRHLHILVWITFSANIVKKHVDWCNNQTYPILRYWDIKQMEMSGLLFNATTRHIRICLVVEPNVGHSGNCIPVILSPWYHYVIAFHGIIVW